MHFDNNIRRGLVHPSIRQRRHNTGRSSLPTQEYRCNDKRDFRGAGPGRVSGADVSKLSSGMARPSQVAPIAGVRALEGLRGHGRPALFRRPGRWSVSG